MPNAGPREFPQGSVRMCSPFLDALTAGYMLRLPQALRVVTDGDDIQFNWKQAREGFGVGSHPLIQIGEDTGWDAPAVYKFMVPWGIEMPEGYAALITHPLNRYDLPFLTLSGLVDVDGYTSPVNLPFVWRPGGDGEVWLDAGLPIAQVVPVLREEWDHEVVRVPLEELTGPAELVVTHLSGYRRWYRRRKVYR